MSIEISKKPRGEFGERLRALRLAKGWSQPDLALKLDVSNGSVGTWEMGPTIPRPEMVKKIAALLDTTVGYLFDGSPEHAGESVLRETAPAYRSSAPDPNTFAQLLDELSKLRTQMKRVDDLTQKLNPNYALADRRGKDRGKRSAVDQVAEAIEEAARGGLSHPKP